MRPKIKTKFLTVVWGQAYIERFAALALPSFLAPGNLPALAELTDLEVVIMTRREDIEYFETLATCRLLSASCPVRFIEIDDLISHKVYGVTLTLAYARPVIACGEDMLDTHFVFMNADFVLADGSLRSLARHIIEGRSIVLGPSFRAVAEAVEGRLEKLVDAASGTLVISPRELARLSLPHPHPTTIAKTRTQKVFHSSHPNQFFWPVDEQTLLGRYYLIFMLCLKPERIIDSINSYCDYSFVPEMCPSGDEVVMADSDDFFMLELQDRDQETHMLRLGPQSEREVARSLQQWTTAEHRRAAQYDIVFHFGDLPPELDTVKAEASAFVEGIGKRLRRPVRHVGHFYWVGGVEVWKTHRAFYGLSTEPPELAPLPRPSALHGAYVGTIRLLGRWRRSFAAMRHSAARWVARGLRMTPLNPSWLDYRLLRETIQGMIRRPGGARPDRARRSAPRRSAGASRLAGTVCHPARGPFGEASFPPACGRQIHARPHLSAAQELQVHAARRGTLPGTRSVRGVSRLPARRTRRLARSKLRARADDAVQEYFRMASAHRHAFDRGRSVQALQQALLRLRALRIRALRHVVAAVGPSGSRRRHAHRRRVEPVPPQQAFREKARRVLQQRARAPSPAPHTRSAGARAQFRFSKRAALRR